MKQTCLIALSAIIFSLPAAARGHKKATKKLPKGNFTLIEAYTQRTLPGMPRGTITTAEHFIVVWKATTFPESIFWRGDNGFLPCMIQKAVRVDPKANSKMPPGIDYLTEDYGSNKVHKGDTLMLTPVTGGKYAVPNEIPATSKNTLFYKTGGSGWLSFPVTTIAKKRDIAMP